MSIIKPPFCLHINQSDLQVDSQCSSPEIDVRYASHIRSKERAEKWPDTLQVNAILILAILQDLYDIHQCKCMYEKFF